MSTSTSHKTKKPPVAVKGEEEEKSPTKKRFLQADVVVVVGKKEFHESSHMLRSFSEYFDAGIRSGMKEAQSMKFEFPDRDPDEWELVMSLLTPFSGAEMSKDNIDLVLPWFDMLCVPKGLEACETFLHDKVLVMPSNYYCVKEARADFDTALKYLPVCIERNFQGCKSKCFKALNGIVAEHPVILTKKDIDVLTGILKNHKDCRGDILKCLGAFCKTLQRKRSEFNTGFFDVLLKLRKEVDAVDVQLAVWNALAIFLPKPVTNKRRQDFLIESGILRALVVSECGRMEAESAKEASESKRMELINAIDGEDRVSYTVVKLRHDLMYLLNDDE